VPPDGPAEHGWRRSANFRCGALNSALAVPIAVSRSSVVLISAWSAFSERYVRVALKAEEGLWVGEQRGGLSALEIELPPGEYTMQVEEPAPLYPAPPGCLDFGVAVAVFAFTAPVAVQSLQQPHVSLASVSSSQVSGHCDALGASPLPLDFFSGPGGSLRLGGPMDWDGRLLVRNRMLLTDIHDGRKKSVLAATTRQLASPHYSLSRCWAR